MTDMSRVLVVGESLVDVVRKNGNEIAQPGGSPLNVAVGLRRLGVPAMLDSSFGADMHGVAIAQHLEASGVTVTPGTVHKGSTSIAEATIGADGAATYRFAIAWDPAPFTPTPGSFAAIHTGSIAAILEPGATRVEKLLVAMRHDATITFDPNVRPQLMGSPEAARARIESFVAMADVVKASDEDLAWLYPDTTLDEVMKLWREMGPSLVVVTRGGDGADAVSESGTVHVDAPVTTVVDTIGAGDSFMAALIAALDDRGLLGGGQRDELRAIDVSTIRGVVEFATRCAAITVSRPGADPPDRIELTEPAT